MKRIISTVLCLLMLFASCVSIVSCGAENQKKADDYATALAKIIDRDYEGAYALFEQLGDYKDSKKYLENFYYMPTFIDFKLSDRAGTIDVLYNEYNLPIKEISHREDMDRVTEFEYDETGTVTKQIVTIDGETSSYSYVYNDIGEYETATYEGSDGSGFAWRYEYNEKGYKITETYVYQGEDLYACIYTYDEDDNIIKMDFKSGDEVINTLDITYTFDENGYITKKVCNYSDGVEEILEYAYDEQGRRIRCVFEAHDDSVTTFNTTYDENGNVVKQVATNTEGTVETAEYEYKLMYLPLGFTYGTELFFYGYWASVLRPFEYYE